MGAKNHAVLMPDGKQTLWIIVMLLTVIKRTRTSPLTQSSEQPLGVSCHVSLELFHFNTLPDTQLLAKGAWLSLLVRPLTVRRCRPRFRSPL